MGRKSLGLTHEEMRIHRELLRKAREATKRENKRRLAFATIMTKIELEQLRGKTTDEIIAELMKDQTIEVKVIATPEPSQTLAGYKGERLRRKK